MVVDLVVDLVVVLVLLGAAVALRLPPLGPDSLWLDDAWQALAGRADSVGELVMAGVTAPGFAALVALSTTLGGDSTTAAQAVPFLAAVAAPALLYLVAGRLGLRRPAALAGAALLLTSPIAVATATRVKPYSLDMVLGLLILAVGWRLLAAPADGRRWGWLVGTGLLAVVISSSTVFTTAAVVGTGLLAAALHRPRRLRPAVSGIGALAVALAGWWALVLRPAVTPALTDYWDGFYPRFGAGPLTWAADVGHLLLQLAAGFTPLPPALTLALLAAAALVVAVRRPLHAVLLLGPLAATVVAASLRLAPFGGGRTDAHLYSGLALLIAVGWHQAARALSAAPDRRTERPRRSAVLRRTAAVRTGSAILAGIAVVGLVLALPRVASYPAEDLRPLVAITDQHAEPGDAIVVYSASRWAYALYTAGDIDLVRDQSSANGFTVAFDDPKVSVLPALRASPERAEPVLARIVDGHDRVWLLTSHPSADVAQIEVALTDLGLVRQRLVQRPGAALSLWERTGTR